ncbi:MAG: methylthioribulose 1-phosphate dehydratase [Thermosynechococcaceae cyanobacterium MS004]|nr:methylthioribulose 1-phosphate dehydratase [Thermosynechococcaceae cyanobacterium MS004]
MSSASSASSASASSSLGSQDASASAAAGVTVPSIDPRSIDSCSQDSSTPDPSTPDPRPQLIHHAHAFHQRGWMFGTAGNLSAKLPDGSFWITASGCSKGELTPLQFVRLSATGELLTQPTPAAKPSAEASIHQAIYACFPEACACYHVHSVPATLLSNRVVDDQLALPAIEMIKGLGVWNENPVVKLALFPNHLQVPRIAEAIAAQFREQTPDVPACLIRNHGVTVWGASPEEARNRVEVIEFLFQYLLAGQLYS